MCPWEPRDQDEQNEEPKTAAEIEHGAELGGPVPGQSLTEQYNPYDYTYTAGPDGMPVEALPPYQSQDAAPIPLTPETVMCLPQSKDAWLKDDVLPTCRYYKRQRVHNPQAPDRPMIQRFCTHPQLRGINGAALVLDDAGIFECEFRAPPHPRTVPILDRIDSELIKKGRVRLEQERKTGKVHGYRLFRTLEDVKQGRFVLDENDTSEGELSRPKIDPMASDD